MAKLTTRDHVWAAALEVAEENATGSAWSRRFGAEDVAGRMDDPPSSKTIRETLQSMVELGALEKGRSQGQYEVRETYRELLEGDVAELQVHRDRLLDVLAEVLQEGSAGLVIDRFRGRDPVRPDVASLDDVLLEGNSHRNVAVVVDEDPEDTFREELEELRAERDELQERADELQGKVGSLEKALVRKRQPDDVQEPEDSFRSRLEQRVEPELEQELEMEPEAEFDTVEQVVGDAPPVDVSRLGVPPAVSNAIADLDLPGEGDVLVDRINLVSNVVAWIRHHGDAGRSELRENVVDPDPAGYADGYSAWKNLVQPALQDLDEILDELESPGEGGHAWRWEP